VCDAGGANRLLDLPLGAEQRQGAVWGGAISRYVDQVRCRGGVEGAGLAGDPESYACRRWQVSALHAHPACRASADRPRCADRCSRPIGCHDS
jgi:hypothetical protein